jgi:hypothetical protein
VPVAWVLATTPPIEEEERKLISIVREREEKLISIVRKRLLSETQPATLRASSSEREGKLISIVRSIVRRNCLTIPTRHVEGELILDKEREK